MRLRDHDLVPLFSPSGLSAIGTVTTMWMPRTVSPAWRPDAQVGSDASLSQTCSLNVTTPTPGIYERLVRVDAERHVVAAIFASRIRNVPVDPSTPVLAVLSEDTPTAVAETMQPPGLGRAQVSWTTAVLLAGLSTASSGLTSPELVLSAVFDVSNVGLDPRDTLSACWFCAPPSVGVAT